MKKFYVVKITTYGIKYKKYKCLDDFSNSSKGCWQFSKQGAKGIVERLNSHIHPSQKSIFHYDMIEVEKVENQ